MIIQVQFYKMISFTNHEMVFHIVPTIYVEYLEESFGIKIAWMFFMLSISGIYEDDEIEND